MSIKIQKYGNVENVTIIEFGKGTIAITNGSNDGYKSLLIKEDDFLPVGEKRGVNENSDQFKPEIAIVFHSKESFDVFKEYVNNIDAEFNKKANDFNLKVLKDSILTIKWYMDNSTTDPEKHESFFNIGMTQITEIEYLIKQL